MKTYRIALMRAYVVMQEYDLTAASPEQAQNIAAEVAKEKRPDPRAEAVDKGWLVVGATGIREVGAVIGPHATTVQTRPVDREAWPTVFERVGP